MKRTGNRRTGSFTKALMFVTASGVIASSVNAAGILAEYYQNIPGNPVSNLTSNVNFPNNPTRRDTLRTAFEIPVNAMDNYGTRVRCFITPPTTGSYTFWISSDDASQLWLGTGPDSSSRRQIAYVNGWTNSREWTRETNQQSAAITLTAGQRYYIEALHKEGAGGDNLAVGWQGPGITGDAERPIPTGRLSLYTPVTAPVISVQPVNRTITDGQTATFSLTATGSSLTYQWRRDAANISGAVNASYVTPPLTFSDTGARYACVVANAGGSVTSNAVRVYINGSVPVITAEPQNQSVVEGQNVSFGVAATGSATLTYQWRKSGTAIPGATAATYGISPVSRADSGYYSCIVRNGFGSDTSANAVLSVQPAAPVIYRQPQSQTVSDTARVTFTVGSSGSRPLSYQWKRNGANISGAVDSLYTIARVSMADSGALFGCVVSNAAANVTSNNALLSVNAIAPVITSQPAGRSIIEGDSARFDVSASGTAPLAYQWRRNGSIIGGATASVYVIRNAAVSDNGALLSCVVSNRGGAVTSAGALLSVASRPIPPVITTEPSPQTAVEGMRVSFTVAATGSSPLIYTWRKNGTPIVGSNTPVWSIASVGLNDSGYYSVIVSNALGADTSVTVRLGVQARIIRSNSQKLAISGMLYDQTGNPLGSAAADTVDLIVRLMTRKTGGDSLYSERFRRSEGAGVPVDKGRFVARLGEGSTLNDLRLVLSANNDLWVEIAVEAPQPDLLQPRIPLTSSAYAVTVPPSGATVLHGEGNPNNLSLDGDVGTYYIDDKSESTWLRVNSGWRMID